MGYRGQRKILKRVTAPKSWMLDKLGGVFAPRPSPGPHKLRESLPMTILMRNKLKYALTYQEVKKIVNQRLIKVDGKVRTDKNFPTGFMDVISIDKTGENFRILYDPKGRFFSLYAVHIEAKVKMCRVNKVTIGPKAVPFLTTSDGRTIRFPNPAIKSHDSVLVDITTGKVKDFVKFESGSMCMITGGRNLGRAGVIVNREKHPGSFDVVHIKDSHGHTFATRLKHVFMIGKGRKPMVSLPRSKGVRLTIAEERDRRMAQKSNK